MMPLFYPKALTSMLLGLVLAIAFWPEPTWACTCRTRTASVQANMHTLQTAVETYAVKHRGNYPKSLAVLYKEATAQDYWKDFANPYTYAAERSLFMADMPQWKQLTAQRTSQYVFGLRVRSLPQGEKPTPAERVYAGVVLYAYAAPNGYRIYGLDGQGQLLRDRGETFFLSHD